MLTDIETARLLDLRKRIHDGEYDLDRAPDRWPFRAAIWITSNAGKLIAYSIITGMMGACVLLIVLLAVNP